MIQRTNIRVWYSHKRRTASVSHILVNLRRYCPSKSLRCRWRFLFFRFRAVYLLYLHFIQFPDAHEIKNSAWVGYVYLTCRHWIHWIPGLGSRDKISGRRRLLFRGIEQFFPTVMGNSVTVSAIVCIPVWRSSVITKLSHSLGYFWYPRRFIYLSAYDYPAKGLMQRTGFFADGAPSQKHTVGSTGPAHHYRSGLEKEPLGWKQR